VRQTGDIKQSGSSSALRDVGVFMLSSNQRTDGTLLLLLNADFTTERAEIHLGIAAFGGVFYGTYGWDGSGGAYATEGGVHREVIVHSVFTAVLIDFDGCIGGNENVHIAGMVAEFV